MWEGGLCFKSRNSAIHENCYDRLISLEKSFLNKGVNLIATNDLSDIESYDALICHDHPVDDVRLNFIKNYKGPKYLIAEEVPYLLPKNYEKQRANEYTLIFTWNKELIDNKKYIYHFSLFPDVEMAKIVRNSDIKIHEKKGKVLVASAKKDIHKMSLYPVRSKLSEWYNNNCPSEFDLYGSGWDRYYFAQPGLISKFLNWRRLDFLFSGKEKKYSKVYKGKINSKYNYLNRYKYQYCIENGIGYSGYVTEKIFDALICRNLPIYYPTDDFSIQDHIPSDLYIDMRNFESFNELNKYLNDMPQNKYAGYISRIDDFLSDIPQKLTSNYASDRIAEIILNSIRNHVK